MPELQTANVVLALGGDARNTVPKYAVTAAEVAVLRMIHGDAAVFDVEVSGSVTRTDRQEIGRLTELYGRQEGDRRIAPAVAELFPGAAARVFQNFDELELPDDLYIATGRQTAPAPKPKKAAEPAPAETDDLDGKTLKELQAIADKEGIDLTGVTKKADVLEAVKTARAAKSSEQAEDGDEDEETGDMPDANLFQ